MDSKSTRLIRKLGTMPDAEQARLFAVLGMMEGDAGEREERLRRIGENGAALPENPSN